MLIPNPKGRYHFLKGIAPYSAGVIADPGFEIVHVTLRDLDVEWRHGFDLIEARLRAAGVEGSALCGVELRSPAPFTMQRFISFNDRYCHVLKQWGLYVGDVNPVARTNVVPSVLSPGVTDPVRVLVRRSHRRAGALDPGDRRGGGTPRRHSR